MLHNLENWPKPGKILTSFEPGWMQAGNLLKMAGWVRAFSA